MRNTSPLRAILFLFFATMAALVLYELDLHYYQVEKFDYIVENRHLFLNMPEFEGAPLSEAREGLAGQLQRLARARNEREFRSRARLVKAFFQSVADGSSPFHTLQFLDASGKVRFEARNDAKLAEHNRFPDALFLKGFSKLASQPVSNSRGEEIGRVGAYYTTPKNDPDIQKITWRYFWIALLVVPAVFAPFVLIDRTFLKPHARVLKALDTSGRPPPLLRPPDSALAARYNSLARDALLQRVEHFFREPGRRFLEESEVYAALPGPAASLLGYPWFLALSVRNAGEEGSPPEARELGSAGFPKRAESPGAPLPSAEELADLLEASRKAAAEGKRAFAWRWPGCPASPKACLATAAADPRRSSRLIVLLAGSAPGDDAPPAAEAWEIETFERLLAEMDSLLDTFALQRRLMARERSEANVSLARNLGHDLTNIIATSKLDLLALDKLAARYEAARPSEMEAEMMRETVDSLQRNARFMQEVVNIYRSFSYLKRPAYETLDAPALLDEIAEVFLLSTGMKVRLERQYADGLPAIQGEPRLLKLAVFNILNNALDALKRSDRDNGGARREARIVIGASPAPDGQGLEITIEDNGPGLRDKAGRLVPPEELGRIFALGYTTKPDSEGEGLGLNWAQTIAREFHGGRLVAENVASGGARFRFELPPRAMIPNIETGENETIA